MQTPPIKLIPAEFLERAKGNVEARKGLAREANLPKVVLDRLVCDRSKSVRDVAARNPGLDAEQVGHLLELDDYDTIGQLNRNHLLPHELVVMQLRYRHGRGVKDDNIFTNPNIKGSEFAELVTGYVTLAGHGSWSSRRVFQKALLNEGVGNGAIIALTEEVFKWDKSEYLGMLSYALLNKSLSGRSVEYLYEKAKRRFPSELRDVVETASRHPNTNNEFIDKVILDRVGMGLRPIRRFELGENYRASERVVEAVEEHDRNCEEYPEFLIRHVSVALLTPERIFAIEQSSNTDILAELVLSGLLTDEARIDRTVMRVASSGSSESIERLNDALYLKSHHVDEMARSMSWSTRQRAASCYNVTDETLKRLSQDNDSDVRRAARENPKWENIKHSVEYHEKAVQFANEGLRTINSAGNLSTTLLELYKPEYEELAPFIDAINTLLDPKFKSMLEAFKNEEQRDLMKNGVDGETLELLKDFF